jgi:dTDP-4-amino-4,6-dideoxygalactose transaminase
MSAAVPDDLSLVPMEVPLLDLQAQHSALRPELDAAIAGVMEHGAFVGGPEIEHFEQRFAAFCAAAECVGVSNGTDALTLCLRAAGIGPGDEVITTAFTFVATVESIVQTGARPVLVDPRPGTALLHVDDVRSAIGTRTAAIVPVHLYGQTVDLDAFRALADRQGLLLVEDAAQAHGAAWRRAPAGSVGDLASFSFFPGKNLGALGDAGAVTTRDPTLARRVRLLRDHGRSEKYRHEQLGTNARLDTLQAAVLSVKLEHVAAWNDERRRHAAAYDAAFADFDGVDPIRIAEGALPVYHQYVVRVRDRDNLRDDLTQRGIATGVHYPIPLQRQPALAGLIEEDRHPSADQLARTVLSLPMYPELPDDQRDAVIAALRDLARPRSAPVEAGAV